MLQGIDFNSPNKEEDYLLEKITYSMSHLQKLLVEPSSEQQQNFVVAVASYSPCTFALAFCSP